MFQNIIKTKMNSNHIPEGFKRRDDNRPKPPPFIHPEVIELSDEDDDDREKYKMSQNLSFLDVKREELVTQTEECDEEDDPAQGNIENQEEAIADNEPYASPGFKSPGCQSISHASSGIGSSRDPSPLDYDDIDLDLALSGLHYQNSNNPSPKVQDTKTNKITTDKMKERKHFFQQNQMDYFPLANSTNNYSFVVQESSQNLPSPQTPHESNIEMYENSNYNNNNNNNNHADSTDSYMKIPNMKGAFSSIYNQSESNKNTAGNIKNLVEEKMKEFKDEMMDKCKKEMLDEYQKMKDEFGELKSLVKYYKRKAEIRTKRRSNDNGHRSDEKKRRISHERRTSTVTSGSYKRELNGMPKLVDYESDTTSDTASTASVESNISTIEPKQKHAQKSDASTSYQSGASSSNSAQKSHHHHSSNTTSQHRSSNHTNLSRGRYHSSSSSEVPKNVDKSFYLSGNVSRCCPICGKYLKRMVHHFKTVHPQFEVYISRISPEMVEAAKTAENRGVKHIKKSVQYIKALCLFCGEKRNFMPHYWIDHFRSHTGEYTNECYLCQKAVSFYTHCGMPTIRNQNEVNLGQTSLYAHMCNKCNFIQIDEKNMRNHVIKQHGKKDNIEQYYREISLMPSMKKLPFVLNPDEVQIVPKQNEGSTFSTSAYRRLSTSHVQNYQISQPKPSTSGIRVLDTQIIRPANTSFDHQIQNYPSMPIIDPIEECDAQEPQAGNAASPATLNLKIDAEEEQNLLNVHKNYNEIMATFKVSVRPWIDEDYAKKPRINLLTQFALYKCMQERCIFATDDEDKWTAHMKMHINWIDVLTKKLGKNFTKNLRDKYIGFRDCSYCGEISKSDIYFLQHMNERHRFSAFQCSYCFYRTNELDNVVLHYERLHKDKDANVLLCSEQREMEDKDYDLLENDCTENIKKFMCGQVGCQYDFACWNSFYAHVRKDHANIYQCPHCIQTVDTREVDNIKNHLIKHTDIYESHEIAEFQCIFCNNPEKIAFHDINDIKMHMSLMHPSHFLFVGARQSTNLDNDTMCDIQIVYVGDIYDHKPYSLYKCSNPDILNSMNPNVLDARLQLEIQRTMIPTMDRFTASIPINFNERENFSAVPYRDYVNYTQSNLHRNQQEFEQEEDVTIQNPKETVQPTEVKPLPNQSPQLNVKPVEVQRVQTQSSTPSPFKKINITYKCISNNTAHELKRKRNDSYKSQLCKDCLQFQLVNDATGMTPFLNHLMNHRADESQKMLCGQKTSDPKNILEHRVKVHGKEAINYLQEEKSESTLVYKLVECKFRCRDCENQEFETVSQTVRHHKTYHTDRYMHAKIIHEFTVIESNDPNQPITHESIIEEKHFQLSQLFICVRDSENLGTKKELLDHHNRKHAKQPLEFNIKSFIIDYQPMAEDQYQMFVFECMHCLDLFDSIDSIHAHIDKIDANDEKKRAGYTMRKLYACTHCNQDIIVSTYNGLRMHHSSMHSDNKFMAANIIHSKQCGICDNKSSNHGQDHPPYDILNMRSLRKLGLDKTDPVNCAFAPECCPDNHFDDIANLIFHVSQCPSSNRLMCNDCGGMKFQNLNTLIEHRQNSHDEDMDAILDFVADFWSPKKTRTIFAKLQVIFKDAKLFTVSLQAIGHVNFTKKVWDKIDENATLICAREKEYIT
ncbi:uncharacterized protein LOC116349232 isoform X2 [Contarinia nasturtii]|uniref:uncharacterized protein LOC116349232 isoform X2 n=1 Tax=Contarinia nasturtii TaxID=265458 RepID=UPI0012D4AAA1|nr:uncharacterized protein LOC116349232 isoform X2 [Contarinia nasturtii]